jgi:hypothetical protein
VRLARELHEEAVRLHEEHARHARAKGDEETARHAEERAARARQRAQATALKVRNGNEQAHSVPADQNTREVR